MSVDIERRIAGGRRIPIKTIVEIGAGEGGSAAFEAESVDVTTSGMHLRTAYLPEVGEPLVCRFEGNGREVIAQGEVVWRKEEACGGDFGVRFSEIDGQSLAVLRELVGEELNNDAQAPAHDTDDAQDHVQRGTRVRLHIEGLASPMKARVRDASPSEVMVGSNLEFLKVGRPLELENVDAKSKRSARIERVNIEVDPASRIPQLVVALRYLGLMGKDTASPATSGRADRMNPTTDKNGTGAVDVDLEDGEAGAEGRGAVLWSKVKQVGPTLITLSGKAKDVVNGAVERAAAYKEKRAAKQAEQAPRRTTAPAPSGGLKSGGRKVVRDDADKEAEQWMASERRKTQKRVAIGGAAALLLLTIVFAASRKPPPAAPSDALAADSAHAAGQDPGATLSDPTAAVPQPAIVANVPLYGATPLSTTEPVPAPPASAIAAANNAQGLAVANPPPVDTITAAPPGAPIGAIGSLAAVGPSESADDTEDGASDDDSGKSGGSSGEKSSAPGTKHFGRGKLHNPIVMGLNMVGNIKSLNGAPTATGFVVHVKGTHSKEPAAGLRKRDPRIASIKVVNTESGSDLNVQFKDGVPAFAVRAKGAKLEIALGRGDAKVAKAGKTEHRKSSTKEKTKRKSSRD